MLPPDADKIFQLMNLVSHPAIKDSQLSEIMLEAFTDGLTKNEVKALGMGLVNKYNIEAQFYQKRQELMQNQGNKNKLVFDN